MQQATFDLTRPWKFWRTSFRTETRKPEVSLPRPPLKTCHAYSLSVEFSRNKWGKNHAGGVAAVWLGHPSPPSIRRVSRIFEAFPHNSWILHWFGHLICNKSINAKPYRGISSEYVLVYLVLNTNLICACT